MKKIKRMISLGLALVATTTLLASCKGEPAATTSGDETIIKIRLMNEVENVDKVIAEYKERVKDDPVLSKITPNITNTSGNYVEKLKMSITAQEDFDLMFYGSFFGMSDSINHGVAKDVSSYFLSDKYPGLKAAFSEEYLKANMVGDALYTIPVAEAYEDIRGVLVRKDLREKYNIPEITNDDELMEFMKVIKENEPDVIPYIGGFHFWETEHFTAAHKNIIPIDIAGYRRGMMFIALDEAGENVVDVVVGGDSPEHFAKLPEGYNTDFITASYEKMTKWVPYMDEDRVHPLPGKEFAVGYGTIYNWSGNLKDLQKDKPDAYWDFYVTDEAQRNMEKGAIVSEMKSNNFVIVPSWSKKTDEVMAFLDWMFGSQENHDLFQYGIEGEDWEAVGTDALKSTDIDEKDKYLIQPYTLTWNPTYIRYPESVRNDPKIKGYYEYMTSEAPYKPSPLSGFAFDPTSIKTEVASVQAVVDPIVANLSLAIYGDETAQTIKQMHEDSVNAGFEKIREQLILQAQAFLDAKNK